MVGQAGNSMHVNISGLIMMYVCAFVRVKQIGGLENLSKLLTCRYGAASDSAEDDSNT